MSPHPPTLMLEGQIATVDDRDAKIADLQYLVRSLQADLANVQSDFVKAQRQSTAALAALRRQLSPLYKALQAVFGELDAVGVDDGDIAAAPGNPVNARELAVWQSWKARLPGGPAKIIDVLLVHREMNTQQLAIATGIHRNSIPAMIYKLNKAGLINKNGNRFSLKTLA